MQMMVKCEECGGTYEAKVLHPDEPGPGLQYEDRNCGVCPACEEANESADSLEEFNQHGVTFDEYEHDVRIADTYIGY